MRRAFGKTIVEFPGVYQIVNRINGKKYIGSAINLRSRFYNHLKTLKNGANRSRYLQNAWNKYGQKAFEFKVVLVCAKKDILFYEQRAINVFRSALIGYNLSPTAGSPLGTKHSKMACYNKSLVMKKRMSSKKFRKKIFLFKIGHIVSEETCKKISNRLTGRARSKEHCQHISDGLMGRTHSKETRLKMSFSQKGRKHSEESKRKISEARKGMVFSSEHRKRIAEGGKGNTNAKGHKLSNDIVKGLSKSIKKLWRNPEYRGKQFTYFHSDEYKNRFENISPEEHKFRSKYVKKGWETRRRNNKCDVHLDAQ